MKPLLVLLFSCFVFSKSKAQNDRYINPKIQQGPYKYRLPKGWDATILPDSTIKLHDLALLKNKRPGVYRLPQDNMPCIVPDSTKTVRMPNAWRGAKRVPYQSNRPRIPNASPRWTPTPIADADSNAK